MTIQEHGMTEFDSHRLSSDEITGALLKEQLAGDDSSAPKARKPYTITKQKERWIEEEHKKFLEGLKLYSSVNIWPELVGLTGEEAEKKIKEDMPNAHTVIVLFGTPVTMDFVSNRVRIIVDASGKVVEPPRIG